MLLKKEVFLYKKYLKEIKMSKVKITQVRSAIDRPQKQKDTLKALGISKLQRPVEKEETPQIAGMIKKVAHLVKVEKV